MGLYILQTNMYACMHNIIVTFPRRSRMSLEGNVVLSGECNKFVGCYP